MNIAIDISPLGNKHKYRGTGVYTKKLLESLKNYAPDHSYHTFTNGDVIPESVQIVHYPYFDPFFHTLPLIRRKPTVVTVHDLIPITYKEHFPIGIGGSLSWRIQRIALCYCQAIITDSHASKRDIVRVLGIDAMRVRVIPLAPAGTIQQVSGERVSRVTKRLGCTNRFILYVGDVNWNKNIPNLLRAYSHIRIKMKQPPDLVCVGEAFVDHTLAETQEIRTLMHNLGITPYTHLPGHISEDDLGILYNEAAVYVQPSFAEGFGLPLLEAMVYGTATVASNVASLREIAGPSIQVNPADPAAIAQGIIQATRRGSHKAYRQKAQEWAERYKWEHVARSTVSLYRQIVGEKAV